MEARVGTVRQFPSDAGVVHDDALYRAPQRGAEFFDDDRMQQLSEKMLVRLSRGIFDSNERGEMLDQAEIERHGNLPPLEQRVARLRVNRRHSETVPKASRTHWSAAGSEGPERPPTFGAGTFAGETAR